MIRFKRLFLALSVLSLCLASLSSVEVHAEHVHATEYVAEINSDDADFRASMCGLCGGKYEIQVSYGPWSGSYMIDCQCGHYFGTDTVRDRTVYRREICNGCGGEGRTTESIQVQRIKCDGYDY